MARGSWLVIILLTILSILFNVTTAFSEENSDSQLIISPSLLNIAPPNQPVTLTCDASAVGENVTYTWYQTPDETTESGTVIENENTSSLILQPFTEKGIYYYYCKVQNENSEEFLSDIIAVAYTGLPTVIIETTDGINPTTEKEKRYGRLLIYYPDGNTYDSDEFSSEDDKFTIKVRGNLKHHTN